MVFDSTSFVPPILVGGIAAITLSSTALKIPDDFDSYYKDINEKRIAPPNLSKSVEVPMGREMRKIESPMAPDTIEQMREERDYYNKKIYIISKDFTIGDMVVRRVHFFEALAILSFMLSEIFILFLFLTLVFGPYVGKPSVIDDSDGLAWYQTGLIGCGYAFLILGIIIITITILISLRDAVYLNRLKPKGPPDGASTGGYNLA